MMAAISQQDHAVKLKDLLADFVSINCLPDIDVTGIQLDSRKIMPGNIFVALSGDREHGLEYAQDALKNGAVAILCDRKFDQNCQQLLVQLLTRVVCVPVENLGDNLGRIASRFYGEPSKNMFVVGVTGTDGKTSVSHFIAQALDNKNDHCAVIGTIGNGLVSDLQESTHTTPDVIKVHELLSGFNVASINNVAMEVSSHGLDQGRVNAVDFNVAVFTNLGRDHLDYHGDLESYKNAKRKLFRAEGLSAAVINLDDEYGCQLANEFKDALDIWGYTCNDLISGVEQNQLNILKATEITTSASGIKMHIESSLGCAELQSDLIGDFNASNLLATLAVMLIHGMSFEAAIKRLEKIRTVPGRVEAIRAANRPLVVIDYAHTPQALASVLKTLKSVCQNKLYCVFGCGGDRDTGKRPLMAAAAEQYADSIVLTDDNPRTEDPENIIDQIRNGFASESNVMIIRDRSKAIAHAINSAGENDIILVAGKGHEDYQLIANEKIPFSDIQVVKACMGAGE